MDLSRINAIAAIKELPLKKMNELTENQVYLITDVSEVTTKYGPNILLCLENEFVVFLPKRICKIFEDDSPVKLSEFRKEVENKSLSLKYLGGKYRSCEFISS